LEAETHMKKLDLGGIWYTVILIVIGIVSFFTKEIVTFFMLGILIIILTNIYDVLKDILEKLDKVN
jgi:hypothetical protein